MIGADGQAMIGGFGSAGCTTASLSLGRPSSSIIGTVRYLSRELVSSDGDAKMTNKSDVWAFGMTTYVSVSGSGIRMHCSMTSSDSLF